MVTADLDELDAVELQDFARDNGLELNPRTGVRHEFFVWLSWNLDRAWLSPWELMRSRLEPARLAAEQRILRRVRTAYTARRRLAAERQLSPDAEGPRGQALQQLRLEELTALLDAQTGGYFSAESRARGAAASSSPMVTAP